MDPLWDQIYWNHLLIVSTTPGHAEYLDASGDKQGQHQGCDTCGSWDGRNFNMKNNNVFKAGNQSDIGQNKWLQVIRDFHESWMKKSPENQIQPLDPKNEMESHLNHPPSIL